MTIKKFSDHCRLFMCVFALSSILLTAFATPASAKTTRQKRLHNLEISTRAQEIGRSIIGLKLGFFSSSIGGSNRGGVSIGDGMSSSVSFDARISPDWYVGTVFDIGQERSVFSSSRILADWNFVLKVNLAADAISGMRFGMGTGAAVLRDTHGVDAGFWTGRVFLEGLFLTSPRFGLTGDIGVSFLNDMHGGNSKSGTQIFIRTGIAFI